MHVCARTQNLEIMTLLLRYNGSAAVDNFKDETAVTIASDLGDTNMIELLAPNTVSLFQKYLSVQIVTSPTDSPKNGDDALRTELFADIQENEELEYGDAAIDSVLDGICTLCCCLGL